MVSKIVIAIVASLHLYFLLLEMFFWTKPLGRKTFGMSETQAKTTAVLAANQGLYNGFLAAGLLWSLLHPDQDVGRQLAIFFLGCVLAAGVYGAMSVNKRILIVQGFPAALGLGTVFLGL